MIRIMSSECFDRLDALCDAGRDLVAGERLFHRGEPVIRLYVVTAGGVMLQRDTIDGNRLILQRALPGDVLAEASLHATRYHCDACADTASTVRSLSLTTAHDSLRNDPALASAWASMLALELQRSRSQTEILRLRSVAGRLDAWLALGDRALPVRGQQRAIAEQIGVSPEALYRELARRRAKP